MNLIFQIGEAIPEEATGGHSRTGPDLDRVLGHIDQITDTAEGVAGTETGIDHPLADTRAGTSYLIMKRKQ